jgi:hypothetical protein
MCIYINIYIQTHIYPYTNTYKKNQDAWEYNNKKMLLLDINKI